MNKAEVYKRYILLLLPLILVILALLAACNFLIDPMASFAWKTPLIKYRTTIDERQQKSNLIANADESFDALLIGSSRVTYMNQNSFNEKLFNYSCSGLLPADYLAFVNYFSKHKGTPKKIYLAVDFCTTNKNLMFSHKKPESYFANSESSLSQVKDLLSIDMLIYSLKSVSLYIKKRSNYYTIGNVKKATAISDTKKANIFERLLPIKSDFIYNENFVYDDNYTRHLTQLKEAYPETEFVVFTTAVSQEMMQELIRRGHEGHYERWLNDTVESFGGVIHFMDANSFTNDIKHFLDVSHMSPDAAEILISRIQGKNALEYPDLGKFLNKENLNAYLKKRRTNQVSKPI